VTSQAQADGVEPPTDTATLDGDLCLEPAQVLADSLERCRDILDERLDSFDVDTIGIGRGLSLRLAFHFTINPALS
jgi:hypothetical protein